MIQLNKLNRPTITLYDLGGPLKLQGSKYGLVLDPEKRAIGDLASVGPGMPEEIHHERMLYVPVRPTAHRASLILAISDNFDLISDLLDSYCGLGFDGNNNMRGIWAERHVDLWQLLQDTLRNVPDVFDPGEYIAGADPSDLLQYGNTVSEIADALNEEALQMAVHMEFEDLQSALNKYLGEHQEMLREADDLDDWEQELLFKLDSILGGEE